MGLYLGSEPVRFIQGEVVDVETSAVREIIEGTISGAYSNSRISTVGSYAFAYCSSLTLIDLPQATLIRNSTFYACGSLTSVSLPQATTIGTNAFANCYSLASINSPQVTTIGSYAFSYCSSLTSVNLPQATSIGAGAFANCYSLASINSPQVTSIGAGAFYACYNLLSLYLLGSSIPTLPNINAFQSTPISDYTTSTSGVYGSIYVPASLYSSYITATNWSTYLARIVGMSWNEAFTETQTVISFDTYRNYVNFYYSSAITADMLKITINNIEYICSKQNLTSELSGYEYVYGYGADYHSAVTEASIPFHYQCYLQTNDNTPGNFMILAPSTFPANSTVTVKIEALTNVLP